MQCKFINPAVEAAGHEVLLDEFKCVQGRLE